MSFREYFEVYGGDYQATMPRFLNKEELYLKFLEMLFDDGSLKKLGDALYAGDLKNAFEAAHTLKGVVGNMGLTPLFHAVCRIVEPLRCRERRPDYRQMYEDILQEFDKVHSLKECLERGE